MAMQKSALVYQHSYRYVRAKLRVGTDTNRV